MSTFNTEKFATTAKVNSEAALTVANTLLAASERLAAHNLNTARDLLADAGTSFATLSEVKDAQGLFALPALLARPSLEKTVAYSRGLYAIASETQAALSRIFDSQYAVLNKEVLASIEEAAKSAPAGSEVAVSAVRQAISAANSAYDNVAKATKQAVELTENNVAAATEAALKTVSINVAKAKKAA
jgi:phasin family protein